MKKKFLSLALIGLLSLGALVGCSSNETEDDKVKIALVLDEGGVHDQSFNESAWNGAKKLKAGITATVISNLCLMVPISVLMLLILDLLIAKAV